MYSSIVHMGNAKLLVCSLAVYTFNFKQNDNIFNEGQLIVQLNTEYYKPKDYISNILFNGMNFLNKKT